MPGKAASRRPPLLGISQREYARRKGLTHGAVQKAIRTGRITKLEDGSIDPALADQQWAANTDEARPRNAVSGDPKLRRDPKLPPQPARSSAGGEVDSGYTAARV